MERMNAGSTAAFGELYDRYSGRATRVAGSICRSPGSADDAVQDAFEGIWKSRATYRADRGPVVAWAMSIVRYRAIAISRGRGVPLAYEIGPQELEPASAGDPVVDDLIARDEAQHLHDLLARIPATQREVVMLAFYGELSHSEIAQRLGLPAGTVKGRMRLGLKKLRDEFAHTST